MIFSSTSYHHKEHVYVWFLMLIERLDIITLFTPHFVYMLLGSKLIDYVLDLETHAIMNTICYYINFNNIISKVPKYDIYL